MDTIKAAIFDLDGTLVDSMWVWEKIDIDFLGKRGHAVPENLKDSITHLSFKQVAEYFKTTFSIVRIFYRLSLLLFYNCKYTPLFPIHQLSATFFYKYR